MQRVEAVMFQPAGVALEESTQVGYIIFEHGEALDAYRQSVIHPRSGRALLAAIAAVEKKGKYEIGGRTRKLMPRGFEADPDRADYLLYEGLYVSISLPADTAGKPRLAYLCLKHYAAMWPVGQWLLAEVRDG